MNVAAAYLAREWERLDLGHLGAPGGLSWVAVTPRYRTSAHVVFLALTDRSADPVLVAKLSRLAGRSEALDREAMNLRALRSTRCGRFDSAPCFVADDIVVGSHLLLETGLPGRPLDASMVRRRPRARAEALLGWVLELHAATLERSGGAADAYDRLVAAPLDEFASRLPPSAATDALVARTRELTAPLRETELPLVLEHGDLGSPNILVTRAGRLGVVDWELAEPASLPAQDLFFALTYLAFARAGARCTAECVEAFRTAFFGEDPWARPYVEQFVSQTRLPREALAPLFVACWSRYVVKRAARLLARDDVALAADTAAWLTQDRFFALWNYTVRHVDGLRMPR